MNKTLISLLVFALLLMFVFSPFAAFVGLILVLFVSGLFAFVINIFKILIGDQQSS